MTLNPVAVVDVAKKSDGKNKRARAGVRNREGAVRPAPMEETFLSLRLPLAWKQALDDLPEEYVHGRALDRSSHIRIAIQDYLIKKGVLKES